MRNLKARAAQLLPALRFLPDVQANVSGYGDKCAAALPDSGRVDEVADEPVGDGQYAPDAVSTGKIC